MQDLTFETMIAVFEEIFGRGLFWAMVVAAVLVTLAYLFVLIRDRSMSMRNIGSGIPPELPRENSNSQPRRALV